MILLILMLPVIALFLVHYHYNKYNPLYIKGVPIGILVISYALAVFYYAVIFHYTDVISAYNYKEGRFSWDFYIQLHK